MFKHVLNPRQKGLPGSPLSIVTGLVDQIDFSGILRPDCDIRMSGKQPYLVCSMILWCVRTCNLGGENICRGLTDPRAIS